MFWYLFNTLPIDLSTYPSPLLVSLGEMNEASVPVTSGNVKWLLFGAVNECYEVRRLRARACKFGTTVITSTRENLRTLSPKNANSIQYVAL